jgi:serine protease inhibitor
MKSVILLLKHRGALTLVLGLILTAFPARSQQGLIDQQKFSSANAGFAFKLLKEIAREQPGTNVFISPYSASTVLQMVCNGAAGQTKEEMQRVLKTSGLAPETLNAANRDCYKAINTQGGSNVILTTANAVWYRKEVVVKPEFISCNEDFFGATVEPLDFADPRCADIMNGWAREKTYGKINAIADGLIDPATDLFLANAVYFKGKWQDPFDAKATRDRVFYLRGGPQRKHPMMEQGRRFAYRRGTGYQAVRLPYQGWSLAMYVFLPDVGSGPEHLIGIMSSETWRRVTKPGFNERQGTLVLPRFKMEYGVELRRPLMALGMRTAFGLADFSGIAGRPLFISAVRQRTFIEVNEEGTEAAAVSGIPVPESAIQEDPPKPFEMIVDRPFLFLVEDQETGTILFMGIVFDPGLSV